MQSSSKPPSDDTHPTKLILRLREATAAAHEEIEHLPVMRRLTSDAVTLEDYHRYLITLASLYGVVEAALYEGLDGAVRERLRLRPKVPALLDDLDEQGITPEADMARAETATHYAPRGASAVVGGLYVLEGATLGGHTIARHLRRRLGDAVGGATFLDFHGSDTAAAWKHFGETLEALKTEGIVEPDSVIAGALAGFDAIYRGLCERGD